MSKFDQHHIEKIDGYIQQHLGNPITVNNLADLLGFEYILFFAGVRKLVGVTPSQYLITRRLDQAKALLSAGSTNIARIASQLGFTDQSHFTRAFKGAYGITPGQFLKQHGG